MAWNVYRIALRLHTPLHIGHGKVSYLQRTYPYVTGRVLRGALVNRIGRNQNVHGENPRDPFRCVSKTLAGYLTFTYFFPALKNSDDYQAHFPWEEDEAAFRRRFLGSYAGTALEYPQQTAAEGLLREVEYLSPRTLDTGAPVYLLGYLFAVDESLKKYHWQAALRRLQLGGERGYGWGLATAERIEKLEILGGERPEVNLFGQTVAFDGSTEKGKKTRPALTLPAGARIWGHLPVGSRQPPPPLRGVIEPLVGREWHANNKKHSKRRHIGQHLAFNGLCYAPGAELTDNAAFTIEEGGRWRWQPDS